MTKQTEFASARQTLQLTDDNVNLVYRYNDITLAGFDRLANIGACYQYFRFTKVVMKFKPYVDTFQQTPTAPSTVPYFHWLINKGDNLDVSTFDSLRDAGAKPIRFDDKTVTISWKPSVHQFIANADSAGAVTPNYGMSRVTPWLSTNDLAGTNTPTWKASAVEHYGLLYGVDQAIVAPGSSTGFGVEVTVYAQFKKPLNNPGAAAMAGPALAKHTVRKSSTVPV